MLLRDFLQVLSTRGLKRVIEMRSRDIVKNKMILAQRVLNKSPCIRYGNRIMSNVAQTIENKLKASLSPVNLAVINESYMHNVPKNSETHFKVVVVSEAFNETQPLARHRMVNSILADELAGPVHALSIVAKTPAQWQQMQDTGVKIDPSPNCQGGDGSLPRKKT